VIVDEKYTFVWWHVLAARGDPRPPQIAPERRTIGIDPPSHLVPATNGPAQMTA
jgi:hypothetical protein